MKGHCVGPTSAKHAPCEPCGFAATGSGRPCRRPVRAGAVECGAGHPIEAARWPQPRPQGAVIIVLPTARGGSDGLVFPEAAAAARAGLSATELYRARRAGQVWWYRRGRGNAARYDLEQIAMVREAVEGGWLWEPDVVPEASATPSLRAVSA